VRTGWIVAPAPSGANASFWDGDHPVYGVWHRPNASARQKSACFDVTLRSNSVGARDVERSRASTRPRVVVLGDSFTEGWGVEEKDRFSSLLERATGVEHLNFGMSHFGPYQEALVYETLASQFAHAAVLIAIVPTNDFFDLDYDLARHAPSYEYRYRPYLVGEGPDFHEFVWREPLWQRWPRRHSYAWNAFSHALRLLRGGDDPLAAPAAPSSLVRSQFYDYTPRQLDLLLACLKKIVSAAGGRPVAACLVPVKNDYLRFLQSGDSPLARRLGEFGASTGLQLIDLLPPLLRLSPDPRSLSFACDYHWNEAGHAAAANVLLSALAGPFYGQLRPTTGTPSESKPSGPEPAPGQASSALTR
jgi:hypothetical protein